MDSLHEHLKQNTASLHREVDELFSGIGFATRDRYGRFLRAQASAVIPLEAALRPFAPTFEAAGLTLAPRMDLLVQDLQKLSIPIPQPSAVRIEGFHKAMGVLYVMQGSRLGGKMLAREISRIDQPDGPLPVSFLDAPTASGWWADFMRKLEDIAVENHRWSAILEGSVLAFESFKRSAAAEVKAMDTQ